MRSLPLLLLLSVGLVSTSVLVPAADALVIPGKSSGLPIDPAVVWGRLDNGIRYALLANDQPKEKISLRLLVTSGSGLTLWVGPTEGDTVDWGSFSSWDDGTRFTF